MDAPDAAAAVLEAVAVLQLGELIAAEGLPDADALAHECQP